jgi:hypothetical protein
MNTRNTTKDRCWCSGYWFPHRVGSRYCFTRADGTKRRWNDPDFHDRALEQIELDKAEASF